MHDLALVNPKRLTVGTPKRVRRKLPPWIEVATAIGKSVVNYEGIPSQSVAEALLDCRGRIMNERLKGATENARREGLLTSAEYEKLKGALDDQTKQPKKS